MSVRQSDPSNVPSIPTTHPNMDIRTRINRINTRLEMIEATLMVSDRGDN